VPTQAYRPRRPAATVLHRTVCEHLETYLARAGCDDDLRSRVPPHVEQAFRAFLRCGILAHGFARAYCHGCGHDFLIPLTCYPYCTSFALAGTVTDFDEGSWSGST